ncbi:hypothetical protein J4460_07235 [Candidatus Woesearchaeota archaeon]|nr:hypothetical protein [Candidatus Woesearchaeota archaeon]HIJ03556.1 hypothetical protein [Candidatus Woesearchaeota archaeon]
MPDEWGDIDDWPKMPREVYFFLGKGDHFEVLGFNLIPRSGELGVDIEFREMNQTTYELPEGTPATRHTWEQLYEELLGDGTFVQGEGYFSNADSFENPHFMIDLERCRDHLIDCYDLERETAIFYDQAREGLQEEINYLIMAQDKPDPTFSPLERETIRNYADDLGLDPARFANKLLEWLEYTTLERMLSIPRMGRKKRARLMDRWLAVLPCAQAFCEEYRDVVNTDNYQLVDGE